MRRGQLVCSLILSILLAACGAASEEDDRAATVPVQEEASTSSGDPDASGDTDAAGATLEDGYQVVRITVTDMGYEPARIRLQAGVPARLIFHQESSSACAAQVQIPALGIEPVDLPQGEETVIEFTPEEEGRFSFACGMLMMGGSILVES